MLTLSNLSLRIAGRLLIEEAALNLPMGTKAGIVGANGTGKTTLFRAILGEVEVESGSIDFPSNLRIGQVAQEAPGTTDTLINIVLSADTERTELLSELETATDAGRIADINTRLGDIDAYSAPARAAGILAGLGFDEAAQQRPVASFSGGWRMRVALAAILFQAPDLLLLDEPTNYLDLEGVSWLKTYLSRYPKTVLLISHDRDLLNHAVNHIVHLERRKLILWRGGYDQFERQYAEKQRLDEKQQARIEAKRKHMQSFVDRFRATDSKAKQAQSRIKAIARLGAVNVAQAHQAAPFLFPSPKVELSPPAVAFDKVSAGYEDNKPILTRLNLRIDPDDRIALLGANGNGKSTFAKLLTRRLPPQGGEITKARKLTIAYFAQHQLDDLSPGQSAVEHVKSHLPRLDEAQARAKVAQMGLSTEKMDTKAAHLSGGEKARLLLGLAVLDAPHILVLDEPTNHLDIDSRRALIDAVNEYKGAVILISHDRHMIDATIDRLWLVDDGTVTPFADDLDAYQAHVVKARRADRKTDKPAANTNSPTTRRRDAAQKRKALAPLAREIKSLESKLAKLEEKLTDIDSVLARGDVFQTDPDRARTLAKDRNVLAQQLEQTELLWLEKSEDYEGQTAGS